jgi:hypothetical protein
MDKIDRVTDVSRSHKVKLAVDVPQALSKIDIGVARLTRAV